MDHYNRCLLQTKLIIGGLKGQYPKMIGSFFNKNILDYLHVDNKILEPSRTIGASDKKYKELYLLLKKFNEKSFINWLINKHNK